MNVEQIQNKTELFSVDYDLEPKDNPPSEDYFVKSTSMLHAMVYGDPMFAPLNDKKRDQLDKLATACNTLASIIKSSLTLYAVGKDTVVFVLYQHMLDLREAELFYFKQIASESTAVFLKPIGLHNPLRKRQFSAIDFLLRFLRTVLF